MRKENYFCYLTKYMVILSIYIIGLTAVSLTHGNETETIVINYHENSLQKTRQQIDEIVYSDNFSKTTQITEWREKQPKTYEESSSNSVLGEMLEKFFQWVFGGALKGSNFNFVEIISIITKTTILLLLLVFFIWLFKKREVWLAWFSRFTFNHKDTIEQVNFSKKLPSTWQELPEKSVLVNFVQQAINQGNFLLALSVLYRGTLREIIQLHDLSITQSSTEQQCIWLLTQARNKQPDEAQFLQDLVQIWSKIAYGQRLPSSQQLPTFIQNIQSLLVTWQKLYLVSN